MNFYEEERDLFEVDEAWHLAHCVASDLRMGAGIAVPMNAKFGLRKALMESGKSLVHPTCVLAGRVFNLITKQRSWDKPTFGDLEQALRVMREIAVREMVAGIAMPRIGCGLDRLEWREVSDEIKRVFSDTDIDVLVCVWKG